MRSPLIAQRPLIQRLNTQYLIALEIRLHLVLDIATGAKTPDPCYARPWEVLYNGTIKHNAKDFDIPQQAGAI